MARRGVISGLQKSVCSVAKIVLGKGNGLRVLIGSTTVLTVRGVAAYLEQVYAYGASLGVQFSENDRG